MRPINLASVICAVALVSGVPRVGATKNIFTQVNTPGWLTSVPTSLRMFAASLAISAVTMGEKQPSSISRELAASILGIYTVGVVLEGGFANDLTLPNILHHLANLVSVSAGGHVASKLHQLLQGVITSGAIPTDLSTSLLPTLAIAAAGGLTSVVDPKTANNVQEGLRKFGLTTTRMYALVCFLHAATAFISVEIGATHTADLLKSITPAILTSVVSGAMAYGVSAPKV